MSFYCQYFSDLIPYHILLTAARVAFRRDFIRKEMSEKPASYLTSPGAFVLAVTTIMLFCSGFVFTPDRSGEWTRAVFGLSEEDTKKFNQYFGIVDDIDMKLELLKARFNLKDSMLNGKIRETNGSLDAYSILIFIASRDKHLAAKMLARLNKATTFDWLFFKVLPFQFVLTIFVFAGVLHLIIKPFDILFQKTLTLASYYLGTFYLISVLLGLLALFDPLLWITLIVWSFLFFRSFLHGIMDLYEKSYSVVILTFTAAMFGTGIILGLSTIFTVWFVKLLRTIVIG